MRSIRAMRLATSACRTAVELTFMEFGDEMRGRLSAADILDPEGNVIVARGRPVTREALARRYKAV